MGDRRPGHPGDPVTPLAAPSPGRGFLRDRDGRPCPSGSGRRMTRATIPHCESSAPEGVPDGGRTSRTSIFPDGRRSSGDNSRSVAPAGGIAIARPFNRIPTSPTTPSSRRARRSRAGSIGGRPNRRVRTTPEAPRGGPSSGSDTRRAASGPPSPSPRSQPPRSRIKCSGMNKHRPIEERGDRTDAGRGSARPVRISRISISSTHCYG